MHKMIRDRVTVLSGIGKFEGAGWIRFNYAKQEAEVTFDDLGDVVDQDLLIGKTVRLIVTGSYYDLYLANVVSYDSIHKLLRVDDLKNTEEYSSQDLKVDIEEEVNIMFLDDGEINQMKVMTRDISAGGFCFISHKELPMQKNLEVVFSFLEEPLLITFQIVRSIPNNLDKRFIYGCSFVDLGQHAEEEIRRKVFQLVAEQRRMAKSAED